jgi:hypothetical protein
VARPATTKKARKQASLPIFRASPVRLRPWQKDFFNLKNTMSEIVQFPQAASRRYEVLTIEDDSLCKIGIKRGDDFVVACGEFSSGDYHVIDVAGKARVLRMRARPPNLIGRVVPPLSLSLKESVA